MNSSRVPRVSDSCYFTGPTEAHATRRKHEAARDHRPPPDRNMIGIADEPHTPLWLSKYQDPSGERPLHA